VTETACVDWTTPARLPPADVHVWRIDLSAGDDPHEPTTLTDDEIARARRLLDPRAQRRFLALRCATRAILARYLDRRPETLAFGQAARGKPVLADPAAEWCFNLSDSRDLALLAVARAHPLGIDVEHVRPVPRRDAIARRLLGDPVVEALGRLPADAADALFFREWTAFEARQKATGDGLAGPRADPGEWPVRHFVPAPGTIAALAHRAAGDATIAFLSFRG
jgi:4'-phosphopantetheinyl transferase